MIYWQIFLSFFWREYKRKKVIKVGKGTRQKRGQAGILTGVHTAVEDVVVDEGDDLTPEEEEIAAAIREDAANVPLDNGQEVHDEKVVQTLKARAIADMVKKKIKITPEHNHEAIGILPKVRGSSWMTVTLLTSALDCRARSSGY